MPIAVVGLILLSVSLSALAQSSPAVSLALTEGHAWRIALSILATPHILTGLGCYVFGMVVWLLVLSKVDVTLAYPFVGLGFLITLVLGVVLLGETVSVERVAGTLLIILGIVLTARS
jgi:multidrug transporter EmrE-like cation transporter